MARTRREESRQILKSSYSVSWIFSKSYPNSDHALCKHSSKWMLLILSRKKVKSQWNEPSLPSITPVVPSSLINNQPLSVYEKELHQLLVHSLFHGTVATSRKGEVQYICKPKCNHIIEQTGFVTLFFSLTFSKSAPWVSFFPCPCTKT